jgi:hypothetical protein
MNGEIESALRDAVNAVLNERLKTHREQVSARLIHWLVNHARKKAVPDLDQQIAKMSEDLNKMVAAMRLEYNQGQLLVKADGTAEETLRKLRLGTSWFDPWPDITTFVLAGIYAE